MQTIAQMFLEIQEEMCDKYCKYPKEYLQKIKDIEDAHELMMKEKCGDCPLQRLGQ